MQSGMEDLEYARRIAVVGGYYFDDAPELSSYLMSVPGAEPLHVLGLRAGRWQAFRTVAAMVALITAVLAGCAIGLLTALFGALAGRRACCRWCSGRRRARRDDAPPGVRLRTDHVRAGQLSPQTTRSLCSACG